MARVEVTTDTGVVTIAYEGVSVDVAFDIARRVVEGVENIASDARTVKPPVKDLHLETPSESPLEGEPTKPSAPPKKPKEKAAKSKTTKPASPGVFPCGDCGRVFAKAQGLGRHRSSIHRPAASAEPASPEPPAPVEDVHNPAEQRGGDVQPTGSRASMFNIGGSRKRAPDAPPPGFPTTIDETRPHTCGQCGHPCRTLADLEHHKRAWHSTEPRGGLDAPRPGTAGPSPELEPRAERVARAHEMAASLEAALR